MPLNHESGEPTVRPMAFLWHPAIKAFVSPFTSEGGRLKFKSRVRDILVRVGVTFYERNGPW
jgi:hypothetical protein